MDFIENWKIAGIEINEHEIEIIKDDKEFDNKMREVIEAGLKVIVDPLLDHKKSFAKGIPVVNSKELLQELEGYRSSFEESSQRQGEFIQVPTGITFAYEFQGKIMKVRILRMINDTLPAIGQEEYFTLPGSSEALFMADKIQPGFPAILVDEEFDAASVLQVAEDVIAPTATGGIKTARHSPWTDLLSQASMVLLSFPNTDEGQEASKWWETHLPNAKIWPIPQEYRNINEMLMKKIDIRRWILTGLEEGSIK
jgi:hypothetical protein